ncbi:MAG TPA: PQQ-binding-like beta-propeller repeat protein [Steroidobacteraceae bacterium]|nr:PQQ-binding-like beta-propeller repeat protein [Steroidobacteraceae bacterium]
MNIRAHGLIGCAAAAFAVRALAQDAVSARDLAGWWSADPVHGGETSHLALQFVDNGGKQEAHLSLPGIGAYDINLGEVTITGNSLHTKGLAFPLSWNANSRTLAGTVPAEAAPIYDIPVEFKRGEPLVKPAPNDWKAARPSAQWSVDTGAAVWAGIERAGDGTLFVGNENGVLSAIRRDGKLRWTFATGKPIRAQPRALGSDVYLHSDSGYLYRLNAKTGAEIWRARVDAGSEPRLPVNEKGTRWDRYGSSVVADQNRLYVASRDRNLYALDRATGHEVWRVAATDIMTATPALYRDLVIFADYSGKVTAVSANDGKPRWTFDAKLAVAGDLTVAADRVLLGSRTYDLVSLDAATGLEQWRRYYWFSWIESPPAVRDGVVYTGSSDAVNVYARKVSDGSLRWKTAVPGYAWSRTAIDKNWVIAGTVGDRAYPGPRAGSLVAMDRATGEIRWIYLDPPSEETVKAHKNWGFGASPVIADGVVYAADLDGRVHCFALN